MVFSSTIFIFIFLPIVLFLYYMNKDIYRNGLLLAVSLLFYAYGEPRFVIIMIASICINYLLALGMERFFKQKKLLLILAIVFDLSLLFVFKYLGFTMRTFNSIFGQNLRVINLALPIGISFFTFQALSYVVDVYRGTSEVQHSIFDLGLYISLFPQLIAGPIVRYNTIADQIKSRSVNLTLFNEGTKRFISGCCKKS